MKYYAKVNPVSSANLQRYLFRLGYIWITGVRKVLEVDAPTLIIKPFEMVFYRNFRIGEGYMDAHSSDEELTLPPEFSEEEWTFEEEICFNGQAVEVTLEL